MKKNTDILDFFMKKTLLESNLGRFMIDFNGMSAHLVLFHA